MIGLPQDLIESTTPPPITNTPINLFKKPSETQLATFLPPANALPVVKQTTPIYIYIYIYTERERESKNCIWHARN